MFDGLQVDDFPLVCARWATSKLTQFEELSTTLRTFGFRGEALASISQFARALTVTSLPRATSLVHSSHEQSAAEVDGAAACPPDAARRAVFREGRMIQGPFPAAGAPGTLIVIDEMFQGLPQRCVRHVCSNPLFHFSELLKKFPLIASVSDERR